MTELRITDENESSIQVYIVLYTPFIHLRVSNRNNSFTFSVCFFVFAFNECRFTCADGININSHEQSKTGYKLILKNNKKLYKQIHYIEREKLLNNKITDSIRNTNTCMLSQFVYVIWWLNRTANISNTKFILLNGCWNSQHLQIVSNTIQCKMKTILNNVNQKDG